MVAMFKPVANWMNFERLDGMSDDVRTFYTVSWRFQDVPDDPWTKRVNDFKYKGAVAGAVRGVGAALPALFQKNCWRASLTAFATALSSADTETVQGKPLPVLASKLSAGLGGRWLPGLLKKQPHKPLHTLNSAAERQAELEKANYQAARIPEGIKRVLIFDDIATRGETVSAIAGAIRRTNPHCEVYGIALGKSERRSYAAGWGLELSNDHVPGTWAKVWDKA